MPITGRSGKLTFPQIIRKGGHHREENAQFVKIVRLKTGYTPDGYAFAACQSYSTHHITAKGYKVLNATRQRYVTVVKFLDAQLHCSLSCSCDDFKYSWEQVLHTKGAAELEYSNGEAPDVRNPLYQVGCCKHLVALYWQIKDRIVPRSKSGGA